MSFPYDSILDILRDEHPLFGGTGYVKTRQDAVATATETTVAASASNGTLLATNAGRRMATFFNDSTASCYLKFGATASTSSFTVKIGPYQYYELPAPQYSGQIDCIWDSATGNMRITEY